MKSKNSKKDDKPKKTIRHGESDKAEYLIEFEDNESGGLNITTTVRIKEPREKKNGDDPEAQG